MRGGVRGIGSLTEAAVSWWCCRRAGAAQAQPWRGDSPGDHAVTGQHAAPVNCTPMWVAMCDPRVEAVRSSLAVGTVVSTVRGTAVAQRFLERDSLGAGCGCAAAC